MITHSIINPCSPKHAFLYFLIPLMIISMTGCQTLTKPGFPKQSYNENEQIQQLETVFERANMISEYYDNRKTPESEKTSARNKIIDGRLALINLHYNQFIRQFSFEKQSLDTAVDMATLGLDLAVTTVGGKGTKEILGAISAGLSGSKLAIDKNFFYEKTVPVLITAMNAKRKEALLPIIKGMKTTVEEYSLAQALSDLDAYYFAGTFIGALQSIQAESGSKEVQAQKVLDIERESSYTNDDFKKQIIAWLKSNGHYDDSKMNQLSAWINDPSNNDIDGKMINGLPIANFLSDARYKKHREKAIQDLKIPKIKDEEN